jgi:hypothetical protein
MLMIRKSTTMIIKKTILRREAQIDHSLELLNTRRRMVMHYRVSMDDKGRNITHMGPPSMGAIEIMMRRRKVTCGSGDLRSVHPITCV